MTVERLDPAARDRIAAGEVVTRPSRVVAELVENSLDAGADRVDVEVAGDGTDRITVRDDGHGMDRRDAERAVERHATSKIRDAGDLDTVETLGFRGEALPSIAAVARLEVTTNDGGPRGTRVVVDDETRVETTGRGRGTTVTVRDLFHNRSPRREALAAPATEFAHISDAVSRYALVRPGVRFSLSHDGSEVFSTPGTGDYADAALAVYDRSVAAQSTAFEHESASDGVRVEGLLCYPSVTRASPDHVHVSVNGRAVTEPAVREAVRAGYGSLVAGDRHPVGVVALELPPGEVDPNVHPAKEEVAFRDEGAVREAVETAVRDALSTADLRRSAEVATDIEASLDPLDCESVFDDATVIGQYRGLYLLCEADDDLLVVDAHAAHERVNFERLRAAVDDGVPSASVDPPATLTLSPAAAATVEAERETLERLGFEVDPFGGTAVRVRAVPAPLGRVAAPEALRDAVDALDRSDPREDLLRDLACHPSLKAGQDVSREEAAALLDQLGACDQPYACPHGRPTVLSIEEETLARGFERGATRLG